MPQPQSQVYVNWGRLIAECGYPGCGDAREVEPGQTTVTCCVGPGCPGHTSELVWADSIPAVLAALDERLSDKRKNWFPAGHPLALAGGFPQNQTVDELRAETAAGEQRDADAVDDRRTAVIAQLVELGVGQELINEIREMA